MEMLDLVASIQQMQLEIKQIALELNNLFSKMEPLLDLESSGDSESTSSASLLENSTNICWHGQDFKFRIVRNLGKYPPSDRMKSAQLVEFSTHALTSNDPVFRDYLNTKNINTSNYGHIFKMLLEMEDLTNIKLFQTLIRENATVHQIKQMEYAVYLKDPPPNIKDILSPQFDEVLILPKNYLKNLPKPKFMIDLLLLPVPEDPDAHVATVQHVNKNRIEFKILKGRNERIVVLDKQHDLVFRSARMPERYQYKALNMLYSLTIPTKVTRYLFPSAHQTLPIQQNSMEMKWINAAIANNPEQSAAVRAIVNGVNKTGPFIVFGPPGTGKTTTIVEAILQLRQAKPDSRILIAAGSNSACDTIALKLCQHYHQQLSDERVELTRDIIRLYSCSLLIRGIQTIDPLLKAYSNVAYYEEGAKFEFPPREIIEQYGIIVATLCTVGKLVSGDIGACEFFTHLFIDEAGASTETECLIGIMGIKTSDKCDVILSGDHKQLGAVLRSKCAAQHGLSISMMERLLKMSSSYELQEDGSYDRTMQARLRRNYRSHPAIVQLYNELYYNCELIAQRIADDDKNVDVWDNWPVLKNANFPIIFQAVYGKVEYSMQCPSSCNFAELRKVLWYVKNLLKNDALGLKQNDIGIISPYKLQIENIKHALMAEKLKEIEVGSVEHYQGREKRIIIASLVRSFTSVGFVSEPRRLNVLLSRPQDLLILIGNPLTLRKNRDFRFLFNECKRNSTFIDTVKVKKKYERIVKIDDELLLATAQLQLDDENNNKK